MSHTVWVGNDVMSFKRDWWNAEYIESTTKNDLAVDCISRKQAIDAFPDLLPNIGYKKKAITEILQEVPSVTPQLSSGLDKNSKKLEKDFGELDCISRKAVIDELKRYFHDEYYQRTSIQDCRDCFIEDVLNHLPSVTPQEPTALPSVTPIRPKGHWIYTPQQRLVKETDDGGVYRTEYRCSCSECGGDFGFIKNKDAFCKFCGADMRGKEE